MVEEQTFAHLETLKTKRGELKRWNGCRNDLFAEIRCSLNFMDS